MTKEALMAAIGRCRPGGMVEIEFDPDTFMGPAVIGELIEDGWIDVEDIVQAIMACIVIEQRWAAIANRTIRFEWVSNKRADLEAVAGLLAPHLVRAKLLE